MHPKLSLLIIADNLTIDSQTGKPSIIGLFNTIEIPESSTSTIVTTMTVFAHVIRAQGKRQAVVSIVDPLGNVVSSVTLTGEEVSNDATLTLRASFSIVEFKELGVHRVKISLDGEDVDVGDQNPTITVTHG